MNFHLLVVLASTVIVSCSTVSHLPKGELLYTGTKSVEIEDAPPSPLHSQAINEAKVAFTFNPKQCVVWKFALPYPISLGTMDL